MDKFIFWTVYWVCKILLTLFRGMRIVGEENVPKTGPVVIAGNHTSNFDPVVMGSAIPRHSRFIAKKELFKNPTIGWFLRQIGAFPIDRDKADLEAIKTSIKIVKDGGALGIFPEGTRNKTGQLGKAQPGAAMIALKARASIVPCAITNSGKGRPVIVRFGKPISLEAYFDRKLSKEEMEEVGDLVMNEIGKLLDMDRKFARVHG